MTGRATDPEDIERRLAKRLERLEVERTRAETFGGFTRCYPVFVVVLTAVTFLPLYAPLRREDGSTWSFGSIWQLLDDDNSGASMFGLLLFAALAVLLTIATFARRVSAGPLVSAAAISLVIAAMILLKPAMPDPPPDIGYGGEAAIAVLLLTAACTSVHAWLLVRFDRDWRHVVLDE